MAASLEQLMNRLAKYGKEHRGQGLTAEEDILSTVSFGI